MTPNSIPIFVNEHPLQVPVGASLRTILADYDPGLAEAMRDKVARCTDGRGLPVDADAAVHAGAIFRILRSARPGEVSDA